MLKQILATKDHMTQAWTKSGIRVPVTVVTADDCYVVAESKKENRIVAGQGLKKLKNVRKPQRSQLEKAGLSFGFRQTKELVVEMADKENMKVGTKINAADVLKVGDIVKVTGTSIGKGFTGVVKRHGFAGGPRTHGQSDRERAPGSIGAGTTPGRVYRNKRMAGRSGNATVTVLNMPIVKIEGNEVWIKGILPGSINSLVLITKIGESEFEGLYAREVKAEAKVEEVVNEANVEVSDIKEEVAPVVEDKAPEATEEKTETEVKE